MLDLRTVNITNELDLHRTKEEWDHKFNGEFNFSPYKKQLEKINVIVGFGYGFWGGVDEHYYIVYHPKNNKFYWFVKGINEDTDVFFYEVPEEDELLSLLKTKSISKNFDLYNKVLDFDSLYPASKGEFPEGKYTKVSLNELFNEDTEHLRIALNYFSPGQFYPHKRFEKQYFLPAYHRKIDKLLKDPSINSVGIYRKNEDLYVDFNNSSYKLVKVD